VTELSPFYLQEARGNMRRWKELRAAGRQLGGVDGTGTTYIQCAVERMPLDDESHDIVSVHCPVCSSTSCCSGSC
jgi:hypothetical protein